ncbi:tetratricopeptide repeat protein [Elongatibacter sediminis]|uniref:Tetratricopeptide repeat protein n=1 Tax=Elongatibacter sediminis TaxID=3119006 RepID=A0AAW9RQ18_9GAMM
MTQRIEPRTHRAVAALLLALLLGACAGPPPGPPGGAPDPDREVQERVREPARQQSEGVQVFPMQNPAVKQLIASARESEKAGRYDAAAVSLERALRIQPRDPEILQFMAEVQIRKQDYPQALNFATRSYDAGPRVGELCSRNWHTISLAYERMGDGGGARRADQRASECMSAKPRGY